MLHYMEQNQKNRQVQYNIENSDKLLIKSTLLEQSVIFEILLNQ